MDGQKYKSKMYGDERDEEKREAESGGIIIGRCLEIKFKSNIYVSDGTE